MLRKDRQSLSRVTGNYGQVSVVALVSMGLLLSIAWLLWSGIFKPLLFGLGALSVVLTLILAVRMNFFTHTVGLPGMLLRLPGYWWWLLKEIVVSSYGVAKIVLSPSLPINPTVIKIQSARAEELPQVILGNSITLSPGTITIDIDEHELIVHCLSKAGAEDLQSGELLRRVRDLEQKS